MLVGFERRISASGRRRPSRWKQPLSRVLGWTASVEGNYRCWLTSDVGAKSTRTDISGRRLLAASHPFRCPRCLSQLRQIYGALCLGIDTNSSAIHLDRYQLSGILCVPQPASDLRATEVSCTHPYKANGATAAELSLGSPTKQSRMSAQVRESSNYATSRCGAAVSART